MAPETKTVGVVIPEFVARGDLWVGGAGGAVDDEVVEELASFPFEDYQSRVVEGKFPDLETDFCRERGEDMEAGERAMGCCLSL